MVGITIALLALAIAVTLSVCSMLRAGSRDDDRNGRR